jgi:protein-L-isoaspartate(D-aspartate) O-methyltransferase
MDSILNTMRQIDRYEFVRDCEFPCPSETAYSDRYVNIAFGLDNVFEKIVSPQPSFLAYYTFRLNLKAGHKILEVGTGIDYHSAIVAKLINPDGKLVTIENRNDLSKRAKENICKNNPELQNIEFIVGDGTLGYKREAPFDRIYLTASVGPCFKEEVMLKQLKTDGILLYPTVYDSKNSILNLVIKNGENIKKEQMLGPRFVPLVGKNVGLI